MNVLIWWYFGGLCRLETWICLRAEYCAAECAVKVRILEALYISSRLHVEYNIRNHDVRRTNAMITMTALDGSLK